MRRRAKVVTVGNVKIGGDCPGAVENMVDVPIEDFEGNVQQGKRRVDEGGTNYDVTVEPAT